MKINDKVKPKPAIKRLNTVSSHLMVSGFTRDGRIVTLGNNRVPVFSILIGQ